MRTWIRIILAALLVGGNVPVPVSAASSDEVIAVLSSDAGPYWEAYLGLVEALGSKPPSFNLAAGEQPVFTKDTRVVVAFGGKAALLRYPAHASVVYCMAPGMSAVPSSRRAPFTKVHMHPPAPVLAEHIKEIQPSLRRLGVLWQSTSFQSLMESLPDAFSAKDVEVVVQRVDGIDDLPGRLRAFKGKVDALWIPPDPLLVNTQSFTLLKEFSWANNVPFYSPTAGLTEIGAAASVSISFEQNGRAAGGAVRRILAGEVVPEAYAGKVEIVINRSAAENSGLKLSPEILRKADKVIP
jgi:putative tryptophan/tyrosine transport system substrate-binding protein